MIDSCNLEGAYDDKCALHCIKGKYQDDKISGVLDDFYIILIQYLFADFQSNYRSSGVSFDQFREYLAGQDNEIIENRLENSITIINGVFFPEYSVQDSSHFLHLLNRLKRVQFGKCDFTTQQVDLKNIRVQFFECLFHEEYTISNHAELLEGESDVLYQNCEFLSDVVFIKTAFDKPRAIYRSPIFGDCKFRRPIHIEKVQIESQIFIDYDHPRKPIVKVLALYIKDSVINVNFKFNQYSLSSLLIEDSIFKKKVELKHNIIRETRITNTNFEGLFDAYESSYTLFKASKSIFDDFTGFEKCIFGDQKDKTIAKVEFEYVTFMSFTNFRKATFFNGLSLEHTNLKESPNFLNAVIGDENTDRETYRIIKHSFDKIGNQIEANKYYSHEMRKYKEELKAFKVESSEWFILWFNEKVSNFGSSIGRPFSLLLACAFIYYLLVLGYESNLLYKYLSNNNIAFIEKLSSQLNKFASGIPPYGRFLKEGMEFVTLLFHLFFLIFTWHFIVAVKRCAKR
ncbi:hypothetical protein RGQ13_12285 [Thalassotalea psychrophila]|uniref:Pentapeptide repeat-containing protein n=1 Tax=Thalassotalea psychrophila TaxID=3065647 RepID=A0ABY9TT40_9GAMM|nr:hypothetical protein RGQ13_12285 [Colwelliaceae bacterium SQ149]